jgi:hypothetical protein
MGIPIMDHHRQTQSPGQPDLFPKSLPLGIPRRSIAIKIQTGFTDRDHPRLPGKFNHGLHLGRPKILCKMGVHAYSGVNPLMGVGQIHGSPGRREINSHIDHPGYPCLLGTLPDFYQVFSKFRRIYVGMGIK